MKNNVYFTPIGFEMKLIIFALTCCLLTSTSLFTMEKRIEHPTSQASMQKRTRGEDVIIKQENNDDYPTFESVKPEPQESPADYAISNIPNTVASTPPPGPLVRAEQELFLAIATRQTEQARRLLQDSELKNNHERDFVVKALNSAIEYNQVEIVRLLLERPGFHINDYERDFVVKALNSAIEHKQVEIVRLLLERPGFPINDHPYRKPVPLVLAANKGYQKIVEMLLKTPYININMLSQGKSALMLAAQNGHKEIVQMLLAQPTIDPNTKGTKGLTALLCAILKGHIKIAELLIARHDIDVNAQDNDGDAALIVAARYGHKEIVHMLLSKPNIAINVQNKKGCTALYGAFLSCQTEIIRMFLSEPNIDVNAQTLYGGTPLMFAVNPSSVELEEEMLGLLLAKPGINVNAQDPNGASALSIAALSGKRNAVQMLIGAGANVQQAINFVSAASCPLDGQRITEMLRQAQITVLSAPAPAAPTDAQASVLLTAQAQKASLQKLEAQQKLATLAFQAAEVPPPVAQQPNPTLQHFEPARHMQIAPLPAPTSRVALVSEVALPQAAQQVSENLETHLRTFFDTHSDTLESFDPNIITIRISPLLFAAKSGNLAIVKRLLERRANINIYDHCLNTPLHLAIMYDQTDVALHLIHSGANINFQNMLGQTPLMLAAKKENLRPILDLLLEKGAETILTDVERKTYLDYLPRLSLQATDRPNAERV